MVIEQQNIKQKIYTLFAELFSFTSKTEGRHQDREEPALLFSQSNLSIGNLEDCVFKDLGLDKKNFNYKETTDRGGSYTDTNYIHTLKNDNEAEGNFIKKITVTHHYSSGFAGWRVSLELLKDVKDKDLLKTLSQKVIEKHQNNINEVITSAKEGGVELKGTFASAVRHLDFSVRGL